MVYGTPSTTEKDNLGIDIKSAPNVLDPVATDPLLRSSIEPVDDVEDFHGPLYRLVFCIGLLIGSPFAILFLAALLLIDRGRLSSSIYLWAVENSKE